MPHMILSQLKTLTCLKRKQGERNLKDDIVRFVKKMFTVWGILTLCHI